MPSGSDAFGQRCLRAAMLSFQRVAGSPDADSSAHVDPVWSWTLLGASRCGGVRRLQDSSFRTARRCSRSIQTSSLGRWRWGRTVSGSLAGPLTKRRRRWKVLGLRLLRGGLPCSLTTHASSAVMEGESAFGWMGHSAFGPVFSFRARCQLSGWGEGLGSVGSPAGSLGKDALERRCPKGSSLVGNACVAAMSFGSDVFWQ